MAKWGEGDPRWIVEERPDATNVNNWHWTEKNATEWSRNKFRNLFEEVVVEDASGRCEVTKLAESTGEAYVNNRKSKLIFFYEWQLDFDWTGRVAGDDTLIEGKIKIPNFSEEYSLKEVDIDVSITKSSKTAEKLWLLMKAKGVPVFRELLGTYLKELREEYSKDVILPTKNLETPEPTKVSAPKFSAQNNFATQNASAKSAAGVKVDTEDLKLSEEFHCMAEDLYQALTRVELVRAFTHSDVIVEAERGGKFSLFNGMVTGSFVELVKDEKIVQRWRFKSWPEAHYSTVTFKFRQGSSGTFIDMTQTGIPKNDFVRTKDGWKNYYWNSLKATFGFGSILT